MRPNAQFQGEKLIILASDPKDGMTDPDTVTVSSYSGEDCK